MYLCDSICAVTILYIMETFNLQARKLNAIEYLAVMQDEKIFAKIEKIINESKNKIRPNIKRMTKSELIARVKKSEHDIRNKKVMTQSQLEKESQLW